MLRREMYAPRSRWPWCARLLIIPRAEQWTAEKCGRAPADTSGANQQYPRVRARDRDRFESDKQFSDVNLIGSATCKLRRPDVR